MLLPCNTVLNSQTFDPGLHLQGRTTPFIGDRSITFLGGPIKVPSNSSQHRHHLEQKVLERVNNTLPVQGQMLRCSNPTADLNWEAAISKLGSEAMKFALNAATDTLPHNNNLERWYEGLHSGACKLCGGNQSLLHVLNSCDVALQIRRYNRRHDQVLRLLTETATLYLPATFGAVHPGGV